MTKKLILNADGTVTVNPEYKSDKDAGQSSPPPAVVFHPEAMVVMTNMNQFIEQKVALPQHLQEAYNDVHSAEYANAFEAKHIDSDALFHGLSGTFDRLGIPLGLIKKLTDLKGDAFHYKIDSSASMQRDSSTPCSEASSYMPASVRNRGGYLSRWEDAEDYHHQVIDLLAYVPTGPIIFSLFDRPQTDQNGNIVFKHGKPVIVEKGKRYVFERKNQTPEEFKASAHQTINQIFSRLPEDSTPTFANLVDMVIEADEWRIKSGKDVRTHFTHSTDGIPDQRSNEVEEIKIFLEGPASKSKHTSIYRNSHNILRDPQGHPITFRGCSNVLSEYEWIHEMPEVAKGVASFSDYDEHVALVQKRQGTAFPYSFGLYLFCSIAASCNQNDLDMIDEYPPLTKKTIETIYGHAISQKEYRRYFDSHPSNGLFAPERDLFESRNTSMEIPGVKAFFAELKKDLDQDMDDGEDDTEEQDIQRACDVVRQDYRNRGIHAGANRNAMYGGGRNRNNNDFDNSQSDAPEAPRACCVIQ